MCECGCGQTDISEAYRIGKTRTVLALQVYPGCQNCDYGPGVALSLFDSPKSEWLDGVDVQAVTPDEFGSNEGRGIPIPIMDVEDLVASAKELDPVERYESLSEWLEEHGSQLLQDAVRRRRKRWREQSRPK